MSTQQGILPPPPGVEPNFINPQNQFHGCTPFVAFYLTINSLALVMRLYTRRFIIRASLAIDDYLCIIAYVCEPAHTDCEEILNRAVSMRVLCSYRSKRHVALSFLSQQRLTGLTGRALGIGRHIWDIPRSASTEIAKPLPNSPSSASTTASSPPEPALKS
ncbi:hypothetical protein AFLA70_3g008901 [Aspergillus flavus AF70]|nr:hypothetical protein AFLA70_3g008901 [Aspergillus flavus AF70]